MGFQKLKDAGGLVAPSVFSLGATLGATRGAFRGLGRYAQTRTNAGLPIQGFALQSLLLGEMIPVEVRTEYEGLVRQRAAQLIDGADAAGATARLL